MYFIITDEKENQYVDGLNVLEDAARFTNVENIFRLLDCGKYLRKVTLPVPKEQSTGCTASWPTDNPDFIMIKDEFQEKWRANMIILGKRYDLFKVETFKYLIEHGANIHVQRDFAFHWSAANNYLDIKEFLVEKGCDNDFASDWIHLYARNNLERYCSNGGFYFTVENAAKFLVKEFNNDPDKLCCAGGLYFTDIRNKDNLSITYDRSPRILVKKWLRLADIYKSVYRFSTMRDCLRSFLAKLTKI